MLVIYVIYLGTGWVHSRRVRIVEREKKKYNSRFIYQVVSEIFLCSCFGLNLIGQKCLHMLTFIQRTGAGYTLIFMKFFRVQR